MTLRRGGLLLDRDGVINHDPGYLCRAQDCQFIDGIFPLVRAFRARNFAVAITTNQAGIGRGYYPEDAFLALMAWMKEEFAREGADIDAVYYCPDHPTEGVGAHRRENSWRKPGPGMLLQAIQDLDLEPSLSWTIGDKLTDVQAGRAAGIGNLVLYHSTAPSLERREDYWIAPSHGAIQGLLKGLRPT